MRRRRNRGLFYTTQGSGPPLVMIHSLGVDSREWRSFEVRWPRLPAIERLECLAAKTLFVQGSVEWSDMGKIAQEFRRVSNISFEKIEGADHMIPLTHFWELAKCILRFLADKK